MKIIQMFSSLILILALVACNSDDTNSRRIKNAKAGDNNLIIGVAWSWEYDPGLLWEALELGVEEINAKGGLLGRNLEIRRVDDKASVTQGRISAQSLVDDDKVIAVIGHEFSYISLATAPIYEYAGILMMSPSSSSPELMSRGYKMVFRNIPSDAEFGKSLAQYAHAMGYKKILIYSVRNDYGRHLSNFFESQARFLGMDILDRLSYQESDMQYFKETLLNWKHYYQADALFIAGIMPHAAKIIATAKEIGMDIPIFGADGLDSPQLLQIGGKATEGVVIASIFHIDAFDSQKTKFYQTFKSRYQQEPDLWATQGYDALTIIAHAIEQGKSAVPTDIAKSLHNIKNWPSITGPVSFSETGNIVGRKIVYKQVRNQKLVFLGNGAQSAAQEHQANRH
mgnify:CR=1 FL=1